VLKKAAAGDDMSGFHDRYSCRAGDMAI